MNLLPHPLSEALGDSLTYLPIPDPAIARIVFRRILSQEGGLYPRLHRHTVGTNSSLDLAYQW